ncbi:MAG TPA: hypothetical protein VIL99_14310 [Ignavibacteria bacterium]
MLEKRIIPLTKKEKDDFFHKHLPYRIDMLTTYEKIKDEFSNRHKILYCAYEASIIACRVLLEFLGLGIDKNNNLVEKREYYPTGSKAFDVKVKDLKGKFADLNSINKEEQDILAKAYLTGSWATAHLTYHPDKTYTKVIPLATKIIRKLLYDNLEKVRKIKIER